MRDAGFSALVLEGASEIVVAGCEARCRALAWGWEATWAGGESLQPEPDAVVNVVRACS